jgi:hypothetical protein
MTRHALSAIFALALTACAARPLAPPGLERSPLAAAPPATCVAGPEPDATAPYTISSSGQLVHWTLGPPCVAVYYDASLASAADSISAAVAAWNAVPCNPLCLDGPTERADPGPSDAADRSIQLVADGSSGAEKLSVSRLTYDESTGRMRNARVMINVATATSEPFFLLVLGKALGVDEHLFVPGALQSDLQSFVQPIEDAVCALYAPDRCAD